MVAYPSGAHGEITGHSRADFRDTASTQVQEKYKKYKKYKKCKRIQGAWKKVKKKPDLLMVLLAVFGLGVAITLLMPASSSRSVAEPASALQAGVFSADEVLTD